MRNWMKRIAVRKRGMEALQTVLLLGVAFVVVIGLKATWDKTSPDVNSNFKQIVAPPGGGGDAEKPG